MAEIGRTRVWIRRRCGRVVAGGHGERALANSNEMHWATWKRRHQLIAVGRHGQVAERELDITCVCLRAKYNIFSWYIRKVANQIRTQKDKTDCAVTGLTALVCPYIYRWLSYSRRDQSRVYDMCCRLESLSSAAHPGDPLRL